MARARPPQLSYSIQVVGAGPGSWRDLYHWLLRIPWWGALAVIVAVYLTLNGLFALAYWRLGGLANARPGSLEDAFYFSVQTLGTIGYGGMAPVSRAANLLVVAESLTGLLVTAVATGLVFVRFSLVRSRMVFAHQAAIAPMDGVPTLMVRLGNGRSNQIHDANIRMILMRTTVTAEGVKFYRSHDLTLVRSYAPALSRSWSCLHRIDKDSALWGETPESLRACEAEISISVSGVDSTSLQFVNGRHTYEAGSIIWGARLADILSETPEGNMRLDLTHFHDVVPTEPIPGFPYSARG